MISIQDMKKLRDIIADSFGVSPSVAGRVIGYYNGSGRGDVVAAMIAGDLSGVAPALAALGENSPAASPEKISTEKGPAAGDNICAGDPVEKISSPAATTAASVPEKITAAGDKISDNSPEKISGKRSAQKTARNASRGKEKKTSATYTASQDQHKSGAKYAVHGATSPAALQTGKDQLETVQGEIIETDILPGDTLPASINDDIENWLLDFSQRYDIELIKASGQQWRSACMYIGKHIQASGILLDKERLKTHGGSKIYKPEIVAALLPIWEYITGLYKHVPLACDFIAFSGVSREWFYDTRNVLTSSRVDIAKKAREIEESALSVAITDHRENPTGRIYYSKARLGWQETTTIQHVSVAASAPAAALPVFGDGGAVLPDSGGEK